MCGIVGYIGDGNAKDIIIDGLKRLEYRGYDSAGIAVHKDGKLVIRKHIGRISNLEEMIRGENLDSHVGIGHTDGPLTEHLPISMLILTAAATTESLSCITGLLKIT